MSERASTMGSGGVAYFDLAAAVKRVVELRRRLKEADEETANDLYDLAVEYDEALERLGVAYTAVGGGE